VATAIATSPADAAPADLGDGNALLAPISHQNRTLLPVLATGPVAADEYLTLDEGMRSKKVRIGEIDDGEVNALRISNRSDLPLFLMAGEVVLGGKQDRIIGKNTIVPPRATQSIPVFCVEHGRWSGRRTEFSSAGALAHNHLRAKASFEGQSEVWSEVKTKNAKRRTDNATDTYRRVAVQQASGTMAGWERAFERGVAALPAADRARLVGYAVALNGEVVAVDVFGAPALFGKLRGKLLRSYITEAIDEPIAKVVTAPTAADVIAFVARAEAAPAQKVYESDEAETVNAVGASEASTRVMKKGAPADKPVYKAVHVK
jgi:hypothetical protein